MITIGIDPEIHLGPLTIAWHGLTIAIGIVVGGLIAARYLDAVAVGLALGVAVGRIGDVINGEHYGPRSDFFLAVRNSHPDSLTPDPQLAYHSGGLYEVLLASLIFAIAWPLRHRLRPGELTWLVVALFSLGRFFEFFGRSDSPELALGLNNAQWTSLSLLVIALAGWWLTIGRTRDKRGPDGAS